MSGNCTCLSAPGVDASAPLVDLVAPDVAASDGQDGAVAPSAESSAGNSCMFPHAGATVAAAAACYAALDGML